MKYALLLLISLIPPALQGQDPFDRDPGLLFNDSAILRLPEYPAGERSREPGQNVDLSANCPTPGNQCEQSSCVGWAICYALTIRWAWEQNITDQTIIDQYLFSPSYIFNQIKEGRDCKSGAYLHKGLDLIRTQGVSLFTEFPYLCSDCSQLPDEKQMIAAGIHKITGSERVFGPGEADDFALLKLLYALDWHNPVIVGMIITPDFHTLKKGNGPWRPSPAGGDLAGHALVVVGYDEDTRMLTLFNSFGPDWGDDGFIKMSFDYFLRQAKYGVILKP